jgi:acyl dehydratase
MVPLMVPSGPAPWREAGAGTPLPAQRVRARNLFRDAPNRIHDDAGAQRLGFAGGLVAGVTIYGYLSRPAVEAWGPTWLERGTASVRFVRPTYDGEELALDGRVVARSANAVAGEVLAMLEARRAGGEVQATLAAGLAWGGPPITPSLAAYPAGPWPPSPHPATAEVLAGLGPLGAPVLVLDPDGLARAADELEDPLPLYRGAHAVAHPALLLQQANRALAENVALGPWIHVASDVSHVGVARAGERLETRGRVARLYTRGRRDWIELELLVVADGARPVARLRHTAIYRLPALPGGQEAPHG